MPVSVPIRIISLIFLFSLVQTQISLATVIDFENLYHNDANISSHGVSYTEDGFTLTKDPDNSFRSYGALNSNFVGSTSLYDSYVGGMTTLKKARGALFSIRSIDLNELNSNQASTITFSGITGLDASFTQSFRLDGLKTTVETFYFNSLFKDLRQVSWFQQSPFHQFDNIVLDVSTVPLPGALPLFATGLIVFGFGAYRRHQKKTLNTSL
jgi:hypothetical protein